MASRMAISVVHSQVEEYEDVWVIHNITTFDDGAVEPGVNVIQKDCMEWRAAEYGIDASDVDTLLDIAMVEPYLTPEEWAEGPHLFSADSVEEARIAHLARCAKAKLRLRLATRVKDPEPAVRAFLANKLGSSEARANNLDFIRFKSDLDDEVLRIKRKAVRRNVKAHQENGKQKKRTRLERVQAELAEGRMNNG